MRPQSFAISAITALVDRDVHMSVVLDVDLICSAIAIKVDEVRSSWVQFWINVECCTVAVHEHALPGIIEF
jgi:hypothetical protein